MEVSDYGCVQVDGDDVGDDEDDDDDDGVGYWRQTDGCRSVPRSQEALS